MTVCPEFLIIQSCQSSEAVFLQGYNNPGVVYAWCVFVCVHMDAVGVCERRIEFLVW